MQGEAKRTRARAMLMKRAFPGDTEKARRMERAIYNWTIKTARRDKIPQTWRHPIFRDRYSQKVMSIAYNLTHPKNPGLGDRVREGEVDIDWVVNANPRDLFPELWDDVYERVAFKALRRQLTVDADNAPDGMFECMNCRREGRPSKKTTFYQMQTRSADEPMTCFIQCLQCQKRWKQ
jgi:DNA-directed RNA polymerase subunit M/transcription elongation factor TFIIS